MKLSLILCSICSVGAVLVALSSCAAPSGGGSGNKTNLSSVTKAAPFVNSLGMKFVPVPGTKILMCTTETTVAQYKAAGLGYQAPQFPQGSNHPAVNVSWNDAKAYCRWLSARDGHTYRLPMWAEWSKAVGSSTYPWGNTWPPPNGCGNYAGQEMRDCTAGDRELLLKGFVLIGGFSDRHKFTSPVGSYPANSLGIHDLGGNAAEWCEEWYDSSRRFRKMNGGSWYNGHRHILTVSNPISGSPDGCGIFGFRVVMVK